MKLVLGWLWALGLMSLLTVSPSFAWAQAAPPAGWLEATVRERGLLLGVVAVFFGGLALNLTPCVYPLIPVTLAFFREQAKGRTGRIARLALAYLVGMAGSYAVLGVIAAKTGTLLGSWLQKPLVLIGVASLIVALALSLFGVYQLRAPAVLTRRFTHASAGLWGAVGMGAVVGLIAAPCVGPFVLGLFLFISQFANAAVGFLLFFTLGLGMGAPYLLLALMVQRAYRLPKAGAWLLWSEKLLGFVLLGLALYYVKPLLPERLMGVAVGGLLLAAGVYLGWLARLADPRRGFRWMRWIVGGVLTVSSAVVVWPKPEAVASVAWMPYSQVRFEQAQRDHHPIVIDIYADWCLPCVEMDHVTFRHPTVVEALSSVVTLRLDVTDGIPEEGEALIERYRVVGAPTVLLFDRTGREQTNLRLLGFVEPEEFIERLRQIL